MRGGHFQLESGLRSFYYAERIDAKHEAGLFRAVYRLPDSRRARAAMEHFAVAGAEASMRIGLAGRIDELHADEQRR